MCGAKHRKGRGRVPQRIRLLLRSPGWQHVAKEGDIAVVRIDLIIEPAMDDNAILRTTFDAALITNKGSRREIRSVSIAVVSHAMTFRSTSER